MNKVAFIVRGVPGSNKRVFAERFAGNDGVIHSPEDFFQPEDDLRIDTTNRARLSRQCLDAFTESVQNNIETVVYSHTNIFRFRYEKYITIAKQHGYQVVMVIMDHPNSTIAAAKASRNVSAFEIEQMIQQFKN